MLLSYEINRPIDPYGPDVSFNRSSRQIYAGRKAQSGIDMIYYLSARVGERFVRDIEGSEHPNDEAARDEAIIAAREMMADAILQGDDISHGVFEIGIEDFPVIAQVPFSEAFRRRA